MIWRWSARGTPGPTTRTKTSEARRCAYESRRSSAVLSNDHAARYLGILPDEVDSLGESGRLHPTLVPWYWLRAKRGRPPSRRPVGFAVRELDQLIERAKFRYRPD